MSKPDFRYVYAMENQDRKRIKIGMATNPEKRLQDLQTGNDQKLSLVHVEPVAYKDAPKVEVLARDIAKSKGKPKTREWISKTTAEEAKYFIQTAHEIVRGKNSPS